MIAIGLSFGCGVAGFTLAAPVLSFINADIGPDANITWVSLGYLLTTSIGLIIVGRISDIFGRRWIIHSRSRHRNPWIDRVRNGTECSSLNRWRDINWHWWLCTDFLCL